VFDLYPAVPLDPLLALVREKETAERKASAAMRDALGDLMQDRSTAPGRPTSRPPSSTASPTAPPAATGSPPPAPTTGQAQRGERGPGPTAQDKQKIDRLIVVALDPGHGGEDPGAIGPTGLREKDVVLAIALQLRDKINANPNMRAFMTRDADYFVPLQDRVRKARRVQADLLVSIHADAFTESTARGASVYALSDGVASSQSARWLADKENAADAIGGVNVKVKRDTQVLRTILDMSTAAQIKDSLKLGGEVLGQLDRVGRLHKSRVEQARFAVLRAPEVPSILVETAFISNPGEEAKLKRADYQSRLVDALHSGIKRYFAKNPPLARNRSA
jgi:N-acetylmuramoyl-L-alanine amidase